MKFQSRYKCYTLGIIEGKKLFVSIVVVAFIFEMLFFSYYYYRKSIISKNFSIRYCNYIILFLLIAVYAFFTPSMVTDFAYNIVPNFEMRIKLQLIVLSAISFLIHNTCTIVHSSMNQNIKVLGINIFLFLIVAVTIIFAKNSISYPISLVYNFIVPMYVSIIFIVKLLRDLENFYLFGVLGAAAILAVNLTTCNLINLLSFTEITIICHQSYYDVLNLIISGIAFYLLFITFNNIDKGLQKKFLV